MYSRVCIGLKHATGGDSLAATLRITVDYFDTLQVSDLRTLELGPEQSGASATRQISPFSLSPSVLQLSDGGCE